MYLITVNMFVIALACSVMCGPYQRKDNSLLIRQIRSPQPCPECERNHGYPYHGPPFPYPGPPPPGFGPMHHHHDHFGCNLGPPHYFPQDEPQQPSGPVDTNPEHREPSGTNDQNIPPAQFKSKEPNNNQPKPKKEEQQNSEAKAHEPNNNQLRPNQEAQQNSEARAEAQSVAYSSPGSQASASATASASASSKSSFHKVCLFCKITDNSS